MQKHFKNIGSQTIIYSLGNISTKLVGLILLPLYTNSNYLTVADYGILAILEAINQIVIALLTFGLPTAMLRWTFAEKDEGMQKKIIFTVFLFLTIIGVLVSIIGFLNSSILAQLIFRNENYLNYIQILAVYTGLSIISRHPLSLLRLREKAKFYAILSLIKFTIILLLNILFLTYYKMGVSGVMLSLALGEVVFLIFSFPFLIKNIQFSVDRKKLNEMLKYGYPLIFSTLFSLLLTQSDRFILQHLTDEASVGIYALGFKIASVINMLLIQSFSLGFLPYAFKEFEKGIENSFFSRTLTYYTLILVIMALGLTFFSKEVIYLLSNNPEYSSAYTIVPFISFAFVFRGMQFSLSLAFHLSKKTLYNGVIVSIVSVIGVILNFALIPHFGYLGASIAMLISFILMFFITIYPAQKVFFIKYEWIRLLKIFLSVVVGLFFYYLIEYNYYDMVISVALKLLVLVLIVPGLILLKFFSQKERDWIKSKIRQL